MEIDVKKLREDFKDPFDLINTSDGLTLFLRKWEPTAIGLDLRGHGLSDGIRGDYPSKERLINDLVETIFFLKKQFKTLLILGHSLGVLTALIAKTNSKETIDGLILLSAGKTVKPGVYKKRSILQKLKILLSSIVRPSKPVIHYYREGILGLDDPLFNFYYTLRFIRLVDFQDLDLLEDIQCPLLLSVGEHDELFSEESARSLLEEIPCKDKEFSVLPGAKHAIEFTEYTFKPLKSWLINKFP